MSERDDDKGERGPWTEEERQEEREPQTETAVEDRKTRVCSNARTA